MLFHVENKYCIPCLNVFYRTAPFFCFWPFFLIFFSSIDLFSSFLFTTFSNRNSSSSSCLIIFTRSFLPTSGFFTFSSYTASPFLCYLFLHLLLLLKISPHNFLSSHSFFIILPLMSPLHPHFLFYPWALLLFFIFLHSPPLPLSSFSQMYIRISITVITLTLLPI